MDEYTTPTPAPSQPASVLPESVVRSIVRDELARAKLADENEMLRAKIAQMEAAANAVSTDGSAEGKSPGEGESLSGSPVKSAGVSGGKAEPVVKSGPGAKANPGPRTVGAMKWL